MRRAVFVGPGQLAWRDAEPPHLQGPGEAIVRPLVVGRCDLDGLYLSGRMPLAAGEPIGHEIIAEIVELSDDVTRLRAGQRAIVAAQISCGQCKRCRAGHTGRCAAVPFGASYGMGRAGNFGGGLSELLRVPFADAMLVPIPASVDPAAIIGLADMATDAWRAVAPPLRDRPAATVLVLGGMTPVIGIYAAGLAVALGAAAVDYVDSDPVRRQRAAGYGARVLDSIDAGEPAYDIVVEASGSAALLLAALRRIAPEAVVTSVAPAFVGPELPLLELYGKGVTYQVGRPNCRAGHDGALHAWAARGFDPNLVAPRLWRFDDACEAWVDPAMYVAVSRLLD
jgi:threonine dehydrogenase-like Zn-dependent dehydrogenase